MVFKVIKIVALFLIFNVYIYFVHSSIGSLGNIDLITGKFEKEVQEKEIEYKRKLRNTKQEVETIMSKNFTIRKCCKENQVFNEALECVVPNHENHGRFFPRNMIVDQHFYKIPYNISKNIVLSDNAKQCNDQKIIIKKNDSLHHFILFETGDLVQVDGSKVLLNYSNNYCLDTVNNGEQRYFILMLCPCKENTCIQKCCHQNEYFNTVTNKCTKQLLNGKPLKVDFYNEDIRVNHSIKHFLVNRPLNCSDKPDEIIKEVDDKGKMKVQEDGYLMHMVENEKRFTEWNSFCIDVFSNGENQTQNNGFYCKGGQKKRTARDKRLYAPFILNKCCKEGESLNTMFRCQKHNKNATIWQPSPQFMGSKFTAMEYTDFSFADNFQSIKLKKDNYIEQSINGKIKNIYIKDILKTYDNSMFCVDNYLGKNSDYAAIFTPCNKYMCLQKCCPYGFYFNIKTNRCVKDDRRTKQHVEVTSYNGVNEISRSADYFLLYDDTSCPGFERPLYANSMGISQLPVQENGDIATPKEKFKVYVWTTPLGYCLDSFSDGKIGLTNGFYCFKKGKGRAYNKIWSKKFPAPPDVKNSVPKHIFNIIVLFLCSIVTLYVIKQ